MEVSLTPELERWIAERIEAGDFQSESAAVGAGIRLLQKLDARRARLDVLRRDIDLATEQLDRGEGVDGEEAFTEVLGWIARAKGASSDPPPGA